MSRKNKILTCLVAGLISIPAVFGQYKLDQPVRITKDQGLPDNDVRVIQKGKDGFMWIGTSAGMCRFDGQQLKVYRRGPDPNTSLFDNSIRGLLAFENEIWAGTSQGISVLSLTTEKFRHYQLSNNGKSDSVYRRFDQAVGSLYKDRQNDIWVGTREKGVWFYDKKRDDFKNFPYPKESYPRLVPALGSNAMILAIEASATNDSIIWVGTVAGLQEINKYSGKVNWYTFPQKDKPHQVALNAFRRIHSNENGLLYVGSWEAGVNVFDPVKKTFTPLPFKDDSGKDLLAGPIGSILSKSENELWISSSLGLVVYDIRKQAITLIKRNQPLRFDSYGVNEIDDNNRVWTINLNGVQYFDPVVQQFTEYSFEHLYNKGWAFSYFIGSDPNGTHLTVCPVFTDGMFRFEKATSRWTKLPFKNFKSFAPDHVSIRGFAEIREGEYLLSSDEGLFTYSEKTQLLENPRGRPPAGFKRWGEIMKDHSGNFWISADADGLIKWNLQSGKFRIFKKELEIGGDNDVLGRTLNFFEDSRGNIWFSRNNGFSVYMSDQDSIINFLYNKNPVNSFPAISHFAEDKNGKIWVSAHDGWYGVIHVDKPAEGIIQKFDLKAKGISESLTSLAADRQGNVWGYTEKQLLKLNSPDGVLSSFDFAYGAQRVDFFHFSFLPSGEMVFGGRNSITIANPATFRRNKEIPEPYITGMQVFNQPVATNFLSGPELKLASRQNSFSISFSAKAYTMPEHVKFRYRLQNFDEWTETGERRFANYTNVPPGDYVFQLQVANNEGIWNTKTLELPLHIATPWWRTWLFRITALVGLGVLIYWLYRYRISQVKKKEKVRTQYEKKLANVEMSALLAQMNPHFLFNSLNSIDSYIIRNESKKASEYLNNFARLMRLILQNSRTNYISLKDELEALDLYLQMEGLRFANRFGYEIKVDNVIDTHATLIPPMLIQPYVENAIWHGLMHKKNGVNGKVELRISKQDDSLLCVIEDNGIGRAKAQELRAQRTSNHKRSMGMQITKDRIEMINKLYNTNTTVQIIDLNDEEGNARGTKVELVIPV